jgi:hypothetical protein
MVFESACTLILQGDSLEPEEVTRKLGAEPTFSGRIGGARQRHASGPIAPLHTGLWRLSADRSSPADLDSQVQGILDKVTSDYAIWSDLRAQFDINMFVGLFMASGNEGLRVSDATVAKLAARRIALDFDIYEPC